MSRFGGAAFTLLAPGVTLLALIAALVGPTALPPKYYYDSVYLGKLTAEPPVFMPSIRVHAIAGSFAGTAWLYSVAGLAALPQPLIATVQVVTAYALCMAASLLGRPRLSFIGAVSLLLTAVPAGVYLGQYSKEWPALVAVATAVIILHHARAPWIPAAAVVTYGALLRPYWILIAVTWLVLAFTARLRRLWARAVLLAAYTGCVSAASVLATGRFSTAFRGALNVGRLDSPDALTALTNPLAPTSMPADMLNIWVSAVRVALPVELLARTSLLHTAALLLELSVSLLMGLAVLHASYDKRVRAAGWSWWSFVLIQGIFEPDLGSVIKHQIAMLPVVCYVATHAPPGHRSGTRMLKAEV